MKLKYKRQITPNFAITKRLVYEKEEDWSYEGKSCVLHSKPAEMDIRVRVLKVREDIVDSDYFTF